MQPRGVLGNDEDPEDPTGDSLTVDAQANLRTEHGTVNLRANGGFTYTPDPGYYGPDGFDYVVRNAYGQAVGQVTIDVVRTWAEPDRYAMLKGTRLAVGPDRALVRNDRGEWHHLRIVTGPTQGRLVDFDDIEGTFTYESDVDTDDPDSFTYALVREDGTEAAQATATITPKSAKLSSVWGILKSHAGTSLLNANGSPLDDAWIDRNGNGTDDPGDVRNAFVTTRNTQLKLKPTVTLDDFDPDGDVWIRGNGSGQVRHDLHVVRAVFDPVKVNDLGNGRYGFAATDLDGAETTGSFSESAGIVDDLVVDWEVSVDGGQSWAKAGTSANRVYVSWATAPASILGLPLYETLLSLGCTAAGGVGDDAAAIQAIAESLSDQFETQSVVRLTDGAALKYYAAWNATSQSTADLLRSTDGRCGSFARIFIDTLRLQGIADTHLTEVRAADAVAVSGPEEYSHWMLINDWTFSSVGSSGGASDGYTHEFVFEKGFEPNTYLHTSFEIIRGDGADQSGIAGHGGVANPKSNHNNHALVHMVFGGVERWYDPSYGRAYSSQAEFEEQALAGVYRWEPKSFQESSVNRDFDDDGEVEIGVEALLNVWYVKPKRDHQAERLTVFTDVSLP